MDFDPLEYAQRPFQSQSLGAVCAGYLPQSVWHHHQVRLHRGLATDATVAEMVLDSQGFAALNGDTGRGSAPSSIESHPAWKLEGSICRASSIQAAIRDQFS